MDDAVARYCAASSAGAIDALLETLAPDPELVSPISGRMVFRGRDDLRVLLTAVYGTLTGLHWTHTVGSGQHRVALGTARILGVRLTDAMVFELAPDGRIRRISPHLRPWLALTLFAVVLGPQVGRHPGVVRRALAAGA
ncbi:MAG TPA: nuclear transport factor 2 family protein [Baekduia sp.]|nr:nuclear transport factor 2 family protein [Baekduia sp.]